MKPLVSVPGGKGAKLPLSDWGSVPAGPELSAGFAEADELEDALLKPEARPGEWSADADLDAQAVPICNRTTVATASVEILAART